MVTPNLPWELESEILSRVPPTSVKQLLLTCKRWYALFKDPIFIKNHLGKAATQMILTNDESVYSFNFSFHGIHNQVIEFTGKLRSLKDSEDVKIYEIFHCDGLFLCTTEDNRLVVWNPCTGQTRWIQSKPSSTLWSTRARCYLGYGSNNKSCNNYKILSWRYYYVGNRRFGNYEIYEFNSDSWRRVVDGDWFFPLNVAKFVKGNTYWFESENNSILRFDFTAEKFERLPLPCQSHEHNKFAHLSTVREEKLALLCQYYSGNTCSLMMKIWVTNTKTDEAKDLSWSEFLVVDFSKIMIEDTPGVISFLVDEENKKVMCCDTDYINSHEHRTIIYIIGEDIHNNVFREVLNVSRSTSTYPLLLSYVPSLVQIPAKQSDSCRKRKNGD